MSTIIRVFIWGAFIILAISTIFIWSVGYKYNVDYNNTPFTQSICQVISYDFRKYGCSSKPDYICYNLYVVFNVTSLSEIN